MTTADEYVDDDDYEDDVEGSECKVLLSTSDEGASGGSGLDLEDVDGANGGDGRRCRLTSA